jgi:hypothetical protein
VRISEITRRALFDVLSIEVAHWSGRLDEPEFLSRIWELDRLPSYDGRFRDAAADIWQHRINNNDWEPDWIFSDPRFALKSCDDETLLRFLVETIHPVVRPDLEEVERLRQSYNNCLRADGYEIVEKGRISGRPVFAARFTGTAVGTAISAAKETLVPLDPAYLSQQITRMEAAVANDTALAIGTAKELVETCCKTILAERGQSVGKDADVGALVKATAKALSLAPDDVPESAKAAETIRRLLGNLAQVTQALAELRNHYGTGHGKAARSRGLATRHAKLAVGAASTLAVFLTETHLQRPNKEP